MARKKKGHGGGVEMESGGMMRWLLTYADMITLLLIFFIIMYASASSDQEAIKRVLESLRATFGGIVSGGQGALSTGGSKDVTPFQMSTFTMQIAQIQTRTQKYVDQKTNLRGKVAIRYNERGLIISLLGDGVFFEKGSTALRDEYRSFLKEIADQIRPLSNQIAVEGHTDDLGGQGSNWDLSSGRAANVVKYFVDQQGLSGSRFSATGFAQYKPLIPNVDETTRKNNRRVDIVILQREAAKVESPPSTEKGALLEPEQPIQVNWQ